MSDFLLSLFQGSTDKNHMLNKIGNGNILRHKRASEEHLITSGLTYTVINPGGLQDKPAGERELMVSNADKFATIYEVTAIPRGDVAEAAVQAVRSKNAKNKAMDLISKPVGEGKVTSDFDALFAMAGSEL